MFFENPLPSDILPTSADPAAKDEVEIEFDEAVTERLQRWITTNDVAKEIIETTAQIRERVRATSM